MRIHSDSSIDYDEIKKYLKKEQPDLAAFTCLSPTINHVTRICQIIKRELGLKCITLVGGTHPTVLPRETLKSPYIDFAVIGEGEVTFQEIVKALKEKKLILKTSTASITNETVKF